MADPLIITLGCRLNAYESEVMRRHAADAGLRRHDHRQHLRGDRRSRAPGDADDPQAAARAPRCAHHRHRLRGAGRAGALRGAARGRSRHRQRREDAGGDVRRTFDVRLRARAGRRHHERARDGRPSDRRLRRRAPAPTCRCRTAAITAAPSASFRSAAARRARCRPARSWRRSAASSSAAAARSC